MKFCANCVEEKTPLFQATNPLNGKPILLCKKCRSEFWLDAIRDKGEYNPKEKGCSRAASNPAASDYKYRLS